MGADFVSNVFCLFVCFPWGKGMSERWCSISGSDDRVKNGNRHSSWNTGKLADLLGKWVKQCKTLTQVFVSVFFTHSVYMRSSRVLSMVHRFSPVRPFATPWTVACQAPLSMGFSRQEYRSGLPSPPPRDLSTPGIEPVSLTSPVLAGRCPYERLQRKT